MPRAGDVHTASAHAKAALCEGYGGPPKLSAKAKRALDEMRGAVRAGCRAHALACADS